MGKILRLARKAFVNVIVIGQRDIDIAPDVREVCNLFIKKESKKKAIMYETVAKNGEFEDPAMKLNHIPPTSIPIRTTDAAFFRFADDYHFQLDDSDVSEANDEDEEETEQCIAISTKSGSQCPADATHGDYCYNHRGWTGETVDD